MTLLYFRQKCISKIVACVTYSLLNLASFGLIVSGESSCELSKAAGTQPCLIGSSTDCTNHLKTNKEQKIYYCILLNIVSTIYQTVIDAVKITLEKWVLKSSVKPLTKWSMVRKLSKDLATFTSYLTAKPTHDTTINSPKLQISSNLYLMFFPC